MSQDFRHGEMHLKPDPLYRLSLDGAAVSDMISTQSGRIFLCTRDRCLYEIDYQVRNRLVFDDGVMEFSFSAAKLFIWKIL